MTDYFLDASAITQAQALPALTFVAADTDLLSAAAAEHLSVENPLNYTHLDS